MFFRDWIKEQTKANGRVGELARSLEGINLPDSDRKSLRRYIKDRVGDDLLNAFDVSYRVFRESA